MQKVKEASRNAPLLYLNLLTKVFKYFKAPLENEEYIEYDDTMIGKEELDFLKYQGISFSNWIHIDEIPKKGPLKNLPKPPL